MTNHMLCRFNIAEWSLVINKQTYESLRRDSTPALQLRLNGKLLDLKKTETIDIQVYYRLRCQVPQSAKLYGLPKLYKPKIPMRPIVSLCGSPTNHLSKHLTSIPSQTLNWRVPTQTTIHRQLHWRYQNDTNTRRSQASSLRHQITSHQHTILTCLWLY